ncbi:MAG: AsmA-like C-terminal domain-containing protein [Gemmatimonas sp.]
MEGFAVAAAGLIILVAIFAVRLSQGPIELNALSPTLAQALKALDPEADITIGETVVLWSDVRDTVQLQARDVRVRGAAGDERANIPELSVSLSIPALLHGLLAPSALEVYGLHLTLIRDTDGKIHFGAATPPAEEAEQPNPALSGEAVDVLLSLFTGAPDPTVRSSFLRRASVVDAAFTLDDRKTGRVWRAPEAHLSIVRDRAGTEGRASLVLDLNGEHPRADVVVRYRPGDDAVAVDASIRELAPATIAAVAAEPILAPLGTLDAPVTARARGSVALDGTVRSVAVAADVGAGRIVYKRAGLGGDDEGLPINSAHVEADLSEMLDRVAIRRLDLDLDGAKLALSGESTLGGDPEAHIVVETASLPVPTLVRYWPPEVAHNARDWLAENLEAGVGEDARFDVRLGPVGADKRFDIQSLDGKFRFRDISVAYFRPLPNARQLAGTATMTADALTFSVAAGTIDKVRITGATVKVNGLDVRDQDVVVDATAEGPLDSIFGILDSPRLGFISQIGVDPKAVSGDTASRIHIAVPLENHVEFSDVHLKVAANVRGVTIPKIALGLDVVDAEGMVLADGNGVSVTGTGKVAGNDAEFAFNENFEGGPGFKRRVWVRGTLDEAARETIGISLAPYLTGPAGFEAVIVQPDATRTSIEAIADLTPSTMTFSDFGWGKDPDERATATLRATLANDRLASIDLLEVRAHDLTATGRIGFAADGSTIASASLPRLAYGGDSDIYVDAVRSPTTGTYDIRVGGPKLDVEPLLDVGDSGAKEGSPMIVDVAVGYARLGEGGGVTGVTAHLERDRKRWHTMEIDAGLESARPVTVRMAPEGQGRTFSVSSSDAGNVLKALDVSPNVRGGRLNLNGRYDDSDPKSPFKGKLEMRDFRLEGAPLLAKVLSVASLTGILDVLRGQGIDFSRFDANITFVDGAVYTDDLLAHGPALGFTGKGNVSLKDKTIDLQGTIVPAYSLNSVLGNIPLLGPILTQGGGVFAANYRMRGSVDNPEVTVNPLSTLAPSFLRNLFNIFQAPAQSAPSESPAPPTAPQEPAPQGNTPQQSAPQQGAPQEAAPPQPTPAEPPSTAQ